jgi:hypothetical protein
MPYKVFGLCVVAFVLVSCQSFGPRVKGYVKSFSQSMSDHRNASIFIIGPGSDSPRYLEFEQVYRPKVEAHLRKKGFQVTRDDDNASLAAVFLYRVGDRETYTESVILPEYVQTSSGGVVTKPGYMGTTYKAPTYGYVDKTTTYSSSSYTRFAHLEIFTAESLKGDDWVKVYEGNITSTGRCGNLSEVIDEMLEGLFSKFPNGSGRVTIPGNFSC